MTGWDADLLSTLADEVRARSEHTRRANEWTNSDELLAIVADRLGVVGSAKHRYRAPPERIARPGEHQAKRGLSGMAFIKVMAGERRR